MKKTILLTLLAAAFLLAGCSTAKPSPVPAELPKISYQPARQTADRFMTQFLAALNAKDCKKIDSALLSESVAKNMTQDSFRRYSSGLEKHLGKIVKTAYVCDLGNPLYRSFVWKLTLERQPADPKIKPIVADVLFQVQVVRVDNAYKILNFIITR